MSLSQVPTNVIPPRSLSVPPNQAVRAASPPPGSIPPGRSSTEPQRHSTPLPSGGKPQPSGPIPQPAPRPSARPVVRPSVSSVRGGSSGAPAVGGRSWPLIVLLLIIDIGLAGSGAFMLIRGLSDPPAAAPTSQKAP
jgi:hypothetical protein